MMLLGAATIPPDIGCKIVPVDVVFGRIFAEPLIVKLLLTD